MFRMLPRPSFRTYVPRLIRPQLVCFTKELPKSSCATDLTSECMCTNDALNAAVAACAMKTCTVYELLGIKHARFITQHAMYLPRPQ